jgi:hypothetical protein
VRALEAGAIRHDAQADPAMDKARSPGQNTFGLFTSAIQDLITDRSSVGGVSGNDVNRDGEWASQKELERRLRAQSAQLAKGSASPLARGGSSRWPSSLILERAPTAEASADSGSLGADERTEAVTWWVCGVPGQYAPLDLAFEIGWADCWLLSHGVGIVSVCVDLVDARWSESSSTGEDPPAFRVTALARLNRAIRILNPRFQARVKAEGGSAADAGSGERLFWQDLILPWLGVEDSDPGGASRFNPLAIELAEMELRREDGTHQLDLARSVSPASQYAKTLTMAAVEQVSDAEWSGWTQPAGATGVPAMALQGDSLDETTSGHFTQRALVGGLPEVKKILAYDLAATSEEANSWGFDQITGHSNRLWQPDLPYIKSVFDRSGVGLWEYWTGVSLRDSTAFIAFDPAMPIRRQMSTYYYGVFVYAYAVRYTLDALSRDIIDHDLYDFARERELRDEFIRFRSVFWFQEVTTDFQGREIFQAIRAGMHIDEIYNTVCEEIRDVGQFIEEKTGLVRQAAVSFIALVLSVANLMPWSVVHSGFVATRASLTSVLGSITVAWVITAIAASILAAVVLAGLVWVSSGWLHWLTMHKRLRRWLLRQG